MKNLKIELEKAIMERFKQHQIATALGERLVDYTKDVAFEKYKGTKISKGGMEYELFATSAECCSAENHFNAQNIDLELIFVATSELNAAQNRFLKKAKKGFQEHGYMGYHDDKVFKAQLWFEESYEIPVDAIIEDRLALRISGHVTYPPLYVK